MELGLARLDPDRALEARGGRIQPLERLQGEAELVMRAGVLRR